MVCSDCWDAKRYNFVRNIDYLEIFMGIIRLKGHIDVPTDRLDAVTAALSEHIALTHEEDGCLYFSVAPSPDNETRFIVSEAFKSQEAFDFHQVRTQRSEWAKVTKGIERHFEIKEDSA